MKVTFTQSYYRKSIDVSIDEEHKITIPYSESKSIIGYIRQVPELTNIGSLDSVSFFFQGGEGEKEEMIINFIQTTESPIKINQLSLYGNSGNRKALGKFKLFMDGSDSCEKINCFILGRISEFVLTNGKQVRLLGSDSIDSLYLGGNFSEFTINIPTIEKVRIFTQNKETTIQQLNILYTNIKKIEITGTENLEISEFLLENSEIHGGIFSNITFLKTYFLNSAVKNTNFYNIFFPTENKHFIISKTTFLETAFTSTKWGNYFGLNTEINDPYSNEKRTIKIDENEMKEIYRMFKYLHDEIGNKTEANKFFAKEMEYYRKSLTWRDLDKKAISLLQELSNNYGNSWIYPLGWLFALSALKTYFSGFTIHMESYGIFFKEFCIFSERLVLNINLIDDFKEINNPLEFIYRLLLAFFIYQFLIALRRISQR